MIYTMNNCGLLLSISTCITSLSEYSSVTNFYKAEYNRKLSTRRIEKCLKSDGFKSTLIT